MKRYIEDSAKYLKTRGFENPEIGIILGTGLGQIIEKVNVKVEVSYNHIPNFPTATVEYHKGKLIYGSLSGKMCFSCKGVFIYMKAITCRM